MLCDLFSLPCFILVPILENRNNLNLTDRLSCQHRCGKTGLDVPGFSRIQNSDWKEIYSQCQEKHAIKTIQRDHSSKNEVCSFPIKTKYSFDTNEWFDEGSNKVLNLPWKSPETTMGPKFYPILNDVLWLSYHDWSNQYNPLYKNGFSVDGFRFQLDDSTRCEKFNNYFESVKTKMSYSQIHEHQMLYEADAIYLCKELSFYCINIKTKKISGPWES